MKKYILILLTLSFLYPTIGYSNTNCIHSFKNTSERISKKNLNSEKEILFQTEIQKTERIEKSPEQQAKRQTQNPIPQKIIEEAQKSVWKITRMGMPHATGFFISKNKFVTNFHAMLPIIEEDPNPSKLRLTRKGKFRSLKLKVTDYLLDPVNDLAVLKIEGEVDNHLSIKSGIPDSSKDLFSIGYPYGMFSITKKTSGFLYEDKSQYAFMSNRHILQGGSSGSPQLNLKGEVVGVLWGGKKGAVYITKIIHLENLLKQEAKPASIAEEYLQDIIKELKILGEQGDALAQHRLGHLHVWRRDHKEAIRWYEKAAGQGYMLAQGNLAYIYKDGKDVERDLEKAAEYFQKAGEEQGYMLAQHELGYLYETGKGVERDLEKAAELYKKAAGQGFGRSQFRLDALPKW